jgi:hypothetical protein
MKFKAKHQFPEKVDLSKINDFGAVLFFDGSIDEEPQTGRINPGGIAIGAWVFKKDGKMERLLHLIAA